ncbi:hypothetical protein MTR_2g095450 [Medicago truncatula]|uniref:Uncharacterized protein n=1 Tax=Medicago truncatula TaxID=3880 RepID=G8A148_MEDTR|nr:hypothetical protein MTR_2g095450 [Medicago truncatula]
MKKVNYISYLEDFGGVRVSVREPMVIVINRAIDESDNMQLPVSFQIKEFKEAVFSMQSKFLSSLLESVYSSYLSRMLLVIFHCMKAKTQGNDFSVALKLVISKANDQIDWLYLKETMLKMGFSHR